MHFRGILADDLLSIMIKHCLSLIFLFLFIAGLVTIKDSSRKQVQFQKLLPVNKSIIKSARQVIKRVIGKRASSITLKAIPAKNGCDTYQVKAKNGQLTIFGSSPVAITYGFNQYLQKACHSMVTWSGKHLDVPTRWPDYSTGLITSPYKYRYYLNVVTFGYSTVYWKWPRWQKELDWMAMHGINMPLAMVGTEAIKARVWKKLGISDSVISRYFTGPAYLPWNRMGNIVHWGGPLPKDWMQKQIRLQHKILSRIRRLGMHPVAPAFGGFVPKQIEELYPNVKLKELDWGGFSNKYHAYILSPNSRLFKKIGKLFIEEWEKEFGGTKFFLSDSFNEMTPPVPENNPPKKYAMLAAYGQSIYQSIASGDSSAVWITQGWTFGADHGFWSPEDLQAFLSKVPNDKMIILDMMNGTGRVMRHIQPVWKRQKGYYGKQWIYSYVPNFGASTPWIGKLSYYASGVIQALQSPYGENLIGFGIAPEGIQSNEVVYELLADMGWKKKPINLDQWITDYCRARYGGYPKQMKLAWKLLRQSVYSRFYEHPKFLWQTPDPNTGTRGTAILKDSIFTLAVKHFLDSSEQLKQSNLYRNDALELTAMYLGVQADKYYKKALLTKASGHTKQKKAAEKKVVHLLRSIDRLLFSQPNDRLKSWLRKARSWGQTPAEKQYYMEGAKRLITTWGRPSSRLSDYAAKMWSGLIRNYYLPRVKMILAGKSQQKINVWEENRIENPSPINKIIPYDCPLAKAKQLVRKFSKK